MLAHLCCNRSVIRAYEPGQKTAMGQGRGLRRPVVLLFEKLPFRIAFFPFTELPSGQAYPGEPGMGPHRDVGPDKVRDRCLLECERGAVLQDDRCPQMRMTFGNLGDQLRHLFVRNVHGSPPFFAVRSLEMAHFGYTNSILSYPGWGRGGGALSPMIGSHCMSFARIPRQTV